MSGEPAVRLEGIRKRFGYREVLRGVDLTVAAGSCLVVLGSNGAGKSTLLRIITTQWPPSAGSGSVLGSDLRRGVLDIRRRTGVVFHQSFLRTELTLDENLRFAADLYGARFGAEAEALIERVGLGARRREPLRTYSQGMVRRANIARSLLHRPELWILDEPFSGLDPEGQALLRELIVEFRRRGGTVCLVTHQVDLGRLLGDQVVKVENGVLRAETANRGGGVA